MATTFRSADVLCPFYRKEDNRSIYCEGIVPGSTIIFRFRGKKKFEIQHKTFCCGRYGYCEINRMLMEAKYAEEDQ